MILPQSITNHHKELELYLDPNKCTFDQWHTIDECLKTFTMYSPTSKKNLDHYYLLHWDTQYFLDSLSGTDKSYIIRNGIRYYVIYMELLSPEYVKEYPQLRLSFRKPTFLSFGFVLVRSKRYVSPSSFFLEPKL